MKGADTLIWRSLALRWRPARIALALLAAALAAAASVRARRLAAAGRHLPGILGARHRDLGPLGEAGKSGRDHALAWAQAFGNDGTDVILLRQHDRSHSHGAVVGEHIDEGTVGPTLNRGGRHDHDLPQRINQHPDVDELAGPELEI